MKLNIDLNATMVTKMLGSKQLKNRMKRYWGTEVIDGVEVFRRKFQLYPADLDSVEVRKIMNVFGIPKSAVGSANFDGVESYYLYLNPKKYTSQADITASLLVNKIETYTPVGEWKDAILNYTESTTENLYVGLTAAELVTYTMSNINTIILNQFTEVRGDTITIEAIGKYVLLDMSGETFQVEIDTASVRLKSVLSSTSFGDMVYITTVSMSYRYRRTAAQISTDSTFYKAMMEEDAKFALTKLQQVQNSNQDDAGGTYSLLGYDVTTDALWYKGKLRVETADSNFVDRDDFSALVMNSVDTGYVQKSGSWWASILGFIILAVGTYFTAGAATPALAAAYMAATVVVLTLVQMALSASGDYSDAETMGGFVKCASIMSMALGIGAIIDNIAREGFKAYLTNAATATTTTATTTTYAAVAEVSTVSMTTEASMLGVTESTVPTFVETASSTSVDTSIWKSLSAASKVLNTVSGVRESMVTKKFEADMAAKSGELSAQEQEITKLYDTELHLGIEDIKWYTQPLKMAGAQFEVDYLYEGTKYNVGRPSFVSPGLNIRT